MEGKIEGRRSRGRPRNTWTTDITNTNGTKYYQPKRAAEDKKDDTSVSSTVFGFQRDIMSTNLEKESEVGLYQFEVPVGV